jgi:type II secretory pathway pseudopilin PulG
MTWEWLALAGLALVALVLLVALARLRRRTGRALEAARAEAAALRERLDRLEEARADAERTPVPDEREYTITRVGEPTTEATTEAEPVRLERAVFADHVFREGVIRLGSLAHGVRRALDAETRNRIRFEMRREVKRARKQRRTEQREAYREWQARQRADLTDDDLRESA